MSSDDLKKLTDRQIIEYLIARDEEVTHWFFYDKCRSNILFVMRKFFDHPVDYDEMVNTLYVLLLKNNAKALKDFKYKGNLTTYCKKTLYNYVYNEKKREERMLHFDEITPTDITIEVKSSDELREDLEKLFPYVKDKRAVYILKRLFFDGMKPQDVADEMGIDVNLLRVLKCRAIQDMRKIKNK